MRSVLWLMAVSLLACAADPKGEEQDVPSDLDAKADSQAKPTDHGAIAFAAVQQASLAGSANYHAWELSLSGPASITAKTTRIAHDPTLDTVLYLYKKSTTGTWGSYIARNDDATSSTTLSQIVKSLGAGDYRVLVKGYNSTVKGPFGVEVDCTGVGCTPAPAGCVFGASQDDLDQGMITTLLQNKSTFTLPQYQAANFGSVMDARVIQALHESSHPEVTDVPGAFAAADDQDIDIVHIYDTVGARAFVAIEYGAGDNPYGAIFDDVTSTEVAALHDSDIDNCTVPAQTCELHQNFGELTSDPAWAQVSKKTVTMASQLTGTQATDALAAIEVAYSASATLAAGLAAIDQGQLDVTVLKNGANTVEVYDYSAGDNTYGAIYTAGSTTLAAEIHDGDFYRCSLLQ